MRTIKDLIRRQVAGIPDQIDEKVIFHIASRVIKEEYGRQGSENITPTFYKNNTLFFTSQSSLWANEVLLKKVYICERICVVLGVGVVEEIKINRR